MDSTIQIRKLEIDDLEKGFLTTLESLRPVNLSLDEAKRVFFAIGKKFINIYVAVQGGQVIGTATLLLERKFIHSGGMVGHIEDVAVRQDKQGLGIGKLLIRHLMEEGKQCYKLVLDTDPLLVGYYEQFGFVQKECHMRLDNVVSPHVIPPHH